MLAFSIIYIYIYTIAGLRKMSLNTKTFPCTKVDSDRLSSIITFLKHSQWMTIRNMAMPLLLRCFHCFQFDVAADQGQFAWCRKCVYTISLCNFFNLRRLQAHTNIRKQLIRELMFAVDTTLVHQRSSILQHLAFQRPLRSSHL